MRIALIGYGKMGKIIEEICLRKGHQIAIKINSANRKDLTVANLKASDVAIEFTKPESAVENILLCLNAGIPVVSGTTGWLEQFKIVKDICIEKNGAFLYASNFSVGVNIFFEINKKLASLMSLHPAYDVQLMEIHHTKKKDAPSGTAITLAEQILKEIPAKRKWINEVSTNKDDLVIISKRIDPAPGTHTVRYASGIDDIEITHTAHNREGFGAGAVLAAEYVFGKKGVFAMKDVLEM